MPVTEASCSRYSATSASSEASASLSFASSFHWKCSSTSAASRLSETARLRGVCGRGLPGLYQPLALTKAFILSVSLRISMVLLFGDKPLPQSHQATKFPDQKPLCLCAFVVNFSNNGLENKNGSPGLGAV